MPKPYRYRLTDVEAMQIPPMGDDKRFVEVLLWVGKYLPIVAPFDSYLKKSDIPTTGVSSSADSRVIEIYTKDHVIFAGRGDWVVLEGERFHVYSDRNFNARFESLTREDVCYGGVLHRTTEV